MKKLNEILLIDDSPATNSLNRRIVERLGMVDKVSIALNGFEALDYLSSSELDAYPNIIFLDIDMPVMDGFQFLEKYKKLNHKTEAGIVVMLTTSINEIDKEKALSYDFVSAYIHKPLTKEIVLSFISPLMSK